MNYSMLNCGNGVYVPFIKIKAVVKLESQRLKREISKIRDGERSYKLIDETRRAGAKSVVILDDDTYVLSLLSVDTLLKRIRELGGKDE